MAVYIPDEKGELAALEETFSQSIPPVPSGELGAAFIKMVLALAIVLILLFASYWFLRRLIQNRLQKGERDAAIQILEKRMLSPKTILYLVEVDNKKILLAESQLEIKRLESFGPVE